MSRRAEGGIEITFTPLELEVAALVGQKRHENWCDKWDTLGKNRLDPAVQGVLGEMAFAKAMDCYFDCSLNRFKREPDVGEVDVRMRTEDHVDLCVKEDDPDDRVVVLVTQVNRNTFRAVGAIRCGDAKRPEWRHFYKGDARNPKPIVRYYVPQAALRPLTADGLATALSRGELAGVGA